MFSEVNIFVWITFRGIFSHGSYVYNTRMVKEMPNAGVFDDLIPVLIDDSVTSTVRQWHMLEAKKEESAEGTAEMTESQESESESES